MVRRTEVSRFAVVLLAALAVGCGDDDGSSDTDDGTTGSTTDVETTLPITISTSAAETSVSATGTTTDTTTTDTTTGDATTSDSDTDDSNSGTSDSDSDTDSTTGGSALEVGYCKLKSPASIGVQGPPVGVDDTTVVYTRFYVETVTDQSTGIDEDARIAVQVGYGADGSDPAADWTWTDATPNAGWDGSNPTDPDFGDENNDEYQADLSFDAAGVYDYASRVSGDGGNTWTYCDLDGSTEGGYTAAMAGDADIGN
jgi:hypothetical protein